MGRGSERVPLGGRFLADEISIRNATCSIHKVIQKA